MEGQHFYSPPRKCEDWHLLALQGKLVYQLLKMWVPRALNPLMHHPRCTNKRKTRFQESWSPSKREGGISPEWKSEESDWEGGGDKKSQRDMSLIPNKSASQRITLKGLGDGQWAKVVEGGDSDSCLPQIKAQFHYLLVLSHWQVISPPCYSMATSEFSSVK